MAKLYIVGTPIGNLGDISPRALGVLREVHCIAAEDTRVTRKLLSHFDIHTPMISYYEQNRHEKGREILRRIASGEDFALVSDAGMPCISDPGEDLVALCTQSGIEVVAVPGPSAVISAVALSGLPSGRFCFEGFLSVNKGSRSRHLAALLHEERTMVFYEAPHKLPATLRDMLAAWGDRRISLCRELTKLHEEVVRTTLAQAIERYETTPPRGEFVLVVEGAPPREEQPPISFEEAVALVRQLNAQGSSLSDASREISRLSGLKKGELYKGALGQPREN